jgi:DNA-binding CsgD family transcriptional regulator
MDLSIRDAEVSLGSNREVGALAAFSGFLSATLAIVLLSTDLLVDSISPLFSEGTTGASSLLSAELITFVVALAIFLAIASGNNDLLITDRGKKVLLHAALVVGLLGPASLLIEGLGVISAALVALSVCLFTLLWGICLSTFNHQILLVLLLFTGIFVGIFMLVFSSLHLVPTAVMAALLFCVSWISLRMIADDILGEANLIDRALSKERHLPGKGNGFTLSLVGSMFGASLVMMHSIDMLPMEITLAVGACLILAGLFMLVSYYHFQSQVGDIARRTLSLALMLALVPFPFLGRIGQIACVCLLLVVGTINLILIIDAVSETARFNQISPIWIVGFEGMVFFLGAAAVSVLNLILWPWPEQGLIVIIGFLAVSSCALQININNQTYPLFSEAFSTGSNTEEADEACEATASAEAAQGSAFWRERIDMIAEQYGLSFRQKEIMKLLVKGRDSKYITEHLNISRSTAKTHVYNLYRKINIHSRQELLDLIEGGGGGGGVILGVLPPGFG